MASEVPKIGPREGGEDYTVLNDPQNNPDMFPQNGGPTVQPLSAADPKGQQSQSPVHTSQAARFPLNMDRVRERDRPHFIEPKNGQPLSQPAQLEPQPGAGHVPPLKKKKKICCFPF